jgi:hypothetical protein
MTVADDGSLFLKTEDLLKSYEVFEPVGHDFDTTLARARGKQNWGEPFPTVTWEKCTLQNIDLHDSHFELSLFGNGLTLTRRQKPLTADDSNTAMKALGFSGKEEAVAKKVKAKSSIERQLAELEESLARELIDQTEHDALRRKILGI